jgi:hypothetical protein
VQQHRPAVHVGDGDVAQVFEAGGAADVADQVFAGMQVGEAAAAVGAELGERPLDLVVGHAERAQRRGLRRDAELPHFAAHRDDLSHAGDG